jgi:subtilisin family serine protease
MGFERVPPHYLGRGVRIGLIDSGASDRHPDLGDRLADGLDLVSGDAKAWRDDLIGSGTHCATLIAGVDDETGVVGLASEAELHVCKVFPEGRVSDLIEALDYCIEQQIDIAQISLVTTEPSTLLAAKIEQARRSGVLCIAAAGDSGGPVAFPANLPSVLAVGALGRIGTYPPNSCHAEQVRGALTPEGFFGAASSNTGPGLDLCAPGVAVIGGLPPAAYGPLDGTAVACAHVSSLAALVLAHHPDFHTTFRVRGPQRVDHLRSLILASCRPLVPMYSRGDGALEGWARFGAGIPDAAVAVGIAPPLAPAQALGTSTYQWAGAVAY